MLQKANLDLKTIYAFQNLGKLEPSQKSVAVFVALNCQNFESLCVGKVGAHHLVYIEIIETTTITKVREYTTLVLLYTNQPS